MEHSITKDQLDKLFIFNDDGTLTHRRLNRVIGTENHKGYLLALINKKHYRIHRLVYFYHTGKWPTRIDHINQDKKDNRIQNLRPITNSDNMANNDKCWNMWGYRGIHSHNGKFRGEVVKLGNRYKTKDYDTPVDAHYAYLELRRELYPDIVS